MLKIDWGGERIVRKEITKSHYFMIVWIIVIL